MKQVDIRVPEEADTKYTGAFYAQHLAGSFRSARPLLERLWPYLHPSSVVDIGCGQGAWLHTALELGAQRVRGLDGHYVERGALLIDESDFTPVDLRRNLELEQRYDLAISVEVAEHLPMGRAASFVHDLCTASDVILFSAAAPYQGGEDHVNEQWPEYWAILFRQQGYRCFDLFRSELWEGREVESWYAQNAFLFVKTGHPLCASLAEFSADEQVLSRVHPEIFLVNVTRYRPEAVAQLQDEVAAWKTLISAYRGGDRELPEFLSSTGFSETNPLTPGRLNYRDASEFQREIEAAMASAEHAATGAAIEHAQAIEAREAAIRALSQAALNERHRARSERNTLVNTVIDASARLRELKVEESPALVRAAELEHQLDVLRLENAQLQQAGTLFHVLGRVLPGRLKVWVRRLRNEIDIRYLKATSYFDTDWYLERYPDVRSAGVDPIRHYIETGVSEGRNPRVDFDTRRYLGGRLKTRRPRRNPLVEYLAWHHGKDRLAPVLARQRVQVDAMADQRGTKQAWYGTYALDSERLFKGSHSQKFVGVEEHDRQTQVIVDRYLSDLEGADASCPADMLSPLAQIREAFRSVQVSTSTARSSATPTYSIVTPFFGHLEFFRRTAASVARLIAASGNGVSSRVEWIVVNDDPRFATATIEAVIPEEIRSVTRVLSDGENLGISRRQNQATEVARNEWLLFLDCDDLIESQSADVLDHYIEQFPYCRFISSAIIDIDEEDIELRRRIRAYGTDQIFEKGMNAGHLAAIRRDLLEDVGGFDPRFSGCQDYDLALRTAIREPILLIPDHLYRYRWHTRSQSVGQFKKQAKISEAVRRAFLQHFMERHWPQARGMQDPLRPNPHGACLVRTQGRRLELLEEAVRSVLQQSVTMTPCLVVHADHAVFEMVSRWSERFGGRVEVLHAEVDGRRRGYPLNVGLNYVEAAGDRFDFFCILDDDDIFYPMFAERLVAALNISGADIAYCTTNSRIPGQQTKIAHPPLPTAALVSGNFIPINAYIVRTALLVKSGARLREDIHYLEDWDFLLSLMHAGARFTLLNETLSEFRIIGDGNLEQKQDPEHFAHCQRVVEIRGALAAQSCGADRFYRDVMDFDFSARPPLTAGNLEQLQRAHGVFGVVNPPLTLKGHEN